MTDNNFKKIGILGGTFNPIHFGHLILAQNALELYKLDKILIMPSGVSYLKKQSEIVSKEHRINMILAAINGNDSFELSTIETDRIGNSYTYETLQYLTTYNKNCKYYFIIGADTLFSIDTWKCPDIIFKYCSIICAPRNNSSYEDLYAKKEYLEQTYNANIYIMDCPEVNISSSSIRKMYSNGQTLKYYMPDEEINYIKKNKLYNYYKDK